MTARRVTTNSPEYPELLRQTQPPVPAYWIRGTALTELQPAVAIVGPRNPTPYGLEIGRELAKGFARAGVTVVSGMARGVDAAAHEAALAAGGTTVAVLGSGIDVPYPAHNTRLFDAIAEHGAVVTEQKPGTPAFRANFPRRNRIIAGLSLAVVVVQAARRSGTLSTAAHARENNRDVFAVPGDVRSPLSEGVHALIRDGAGLCESACDVLEGLGLPVRAHADGVVPAGLAATEQLVWRALDQAPADVATVARSAGLAKSTAERALAGLELIGLVRRTKGETYKRA